MRNCFFYYIYFLCKLQYNFHVIHFFVKITNHCLVLFVIFHIKHQSFPLRELSSSGYSQSASLRSSIPNNCSAFHQKELIFYPYQKLIITMQFFYFKSILIQLNPLEHNEHGRMKSESSPAKVAPPLSWNKSILKGVTGLQGFTRPNRDSLPSQCKCSEGAPAYHPWVKPMVKRHKEISSPEGAKASMLF